ncbi:MAG: DNA-binding protein [Candidatus Tectomicrobia bacterium]|nr:DNA-binding protein [Candidatus Tectomicrobia bacterium]
MTSRQLPPERRNGAVLDRWKSERTEQRSIAVPDVPDTLTRALQAVWPTAYRAADDLLEARRLFWNDTNTTDICRFHTRE